MTPGQARALYNTCTQTLIGADDEGNEFYQTTRFGTMMQTLGCPLVLWEQIPGGYEFKLDAAHQVQKKIHEFADALLPESEPGNELLEMLKELAGFLEEVARGEIMPNSYTTGPARELIAKYEGEED